MYLPPIPVCCDLQRLGFQFLLERNFLQFLSKLTFLKMYKDEYIFQMKFLYHQRVRECIVSFRNAGEFMHCNVTHFFLDDYISWSV